MLVGRVQIGRRIAILFVLGVLGERDRLPEENESHLEIYLRALREKNFLQTRAAPAHQLFIEYIDSIERGGS